MNRSRTIFWLLAAALCVALAQPNSLLACAACYGKSDSAMAKGMNAGIFTLLGVVACVLASIAMFFVHAVRRESQLPPDERDESKPPKL